MQALSPPWRFVSKKNRVGGTALFQAAAHAFHLDGESSVTQALLEFPIFSRGPDGQHAVHPERRKGGGDSAIIVEPRVIRGGKSGWAVVYIEQYSIKLAGA
jgi:hypothetical protein